MVYVRDGKGSMNFWAPLVVFEALERLVEKEGRSRNDIVVEAVCKYLVEKGVMSREELEKVMEERKRIARSPPGKRGEGKAERMRREGRLVARFGELELYEYEGGLYVTTVTRSTYYMSAQRFLKSPMWYLEHVFGKYRRQDIARMKEYLKKIYGEVEEG